MTISVISGAGERAVRKQYSTGILSCNYNAPYAGHVTNSGLPDSISDASHVSSHSFFVYTRAHGQEGQER